MAPLSGDSLYERLGVERSTSTAEIRKAYHRAALRWHPDHHQGDPDAAERFKACLEAYEVLSDPTKRLFYNQQNPAAIGPEERKRQQQQQQQSWCWLQRDEVYYRHCTEYYEQQRYFEERQRQREAEKQQWQMNAEKRNQEECRQSREEMDWIIREATLRRQKEAEEQQQLHQQRNV